MNGEDPVRNALQELRDEPLGPETAARVERMARAAFLRHASPLARFDDVALGRVVPVILCGCSLFYAISLWRFFGTFY